MALTIDSLADPFEEFFLDKFKKKDTTQKFKDIFFCFDSLEKSASSENFLDNPSDPNSYNELKAKSFFSTEVNKIPVISEPFVTFKIDTIGDVFTMNIVGLSQPFVQQIQDQTTRETQIMNFITLKNKINRAYAECLLPFSELPIKKLFSFANPEKWYDSRIEGNWTRHTINVSETSTSQTGKPKVKTGIDLWRKIADPTLLFKSIDSQIIKPLPKTVHVSLDKLSKVSLASQLNLVTPTQETAAESAPDQLEAAPSALLNSILLNTPVVKMNPLLSNKFTLLLKRNVSKEILTKAILTNTVTTKVTTKKLSLSFMYQVVGIEMPWFSMPFVNQDNWFVLGKKKGQISQEMLPAIPVGFVAIKDLKITGEWTAEDIKNAKESYGFGPFIFTKETIINKGVMESEGVHISGWLFQKMPALPPMDVPAIT